MDSVVIGIVIFIIIIFFSLLKTKKTNEEKKKKEHVLITKQEDFEFLKTVNFLSVSSSKLKRKQLAKIFAHYKQSEQASGLYILYKGSDENFIFVKFVTAEGEVCTNIFDINDKEYLAGAPGLEILKEISDYSKFYQQYENKIVTESMLKKYVENDENQPN